MMPTSREFECNADNPWSGGSNLTRCSCNLMWISLYFSFSPWDWLHAQLPHAAGASEAFGGGAGTEPKLSGTNACSAPCENSRRRRKLSRALVQKSGWTARGHEGKRENSCSCVFPSSISRELRLGLGDKGVVGAFEVVRLHAAPVGWVKRSADPTPGRSTRVGSSLTLDPTYDSHPRGLLN
jgi:hypothetical protein